MNRTFILGAHPEARRRAVEAVIDAPAGMVVTLKPATRTSAENALLHAIITDISKQLDWAGKKRDVETWKRLLVSAWCRVRGESVEILPALDGHGVDIVPARTSKLSKGECADLIDFIYAWGVEHEVNFSEPHANP